MLVTVSDDTAMGADFVRDTSGRIGWLSWIANLQPRPY
jgi:hypothetical protein